MNRVIYQHGLVIGKFYPPHLGHEYLIRTAAQHCQTVTVGVLANSEESIPLQSRVAWLRESFADQGHVRIVGQVDDVPVDYNDAAIWQAHIDIMRQAVQQADSLCGQTAPAVDVVFSSEPYGDEMARYFNAAHVCLDQSRVLYPVSGTAVRNHLPDYWHLLSPAVQAGLTLRVVVVGAESTGTTTLARDLTRALQQRGGVWAATQYVAEYGREYSANLLALARSQNKQATPQELVWDEADFIHIAQEQNRREELAAHHGSPILIGDTDALATCIWHERYRRSPNAAVQAIAEAMPPRALYLLTDHRGVDFEDDGLRDGEHLRPWMTERFQAVLSAQTVPWLQLHGSPAERCAAALQAVDAMALQAWDFSLPLEQRA